MRRSGVFVLPLLSVLMLLGLSPELTAQDRDSADALAKSPKAVTHNSRKAVLSSSVATNAGKSLLSQTRPDIIPANSSGEPLNRTQDNPFAAVGDSWRMVAYLFPLLALMVVGLNLLRRYHERNGRLPATLQAVVNKAPGSDVSSHRQRIGLFQSLLGGLNLHSARQTGGSSIRTVESVPLGGVNLHLIAVRGRLLLLGATGSNVNLLAEWEEKSGPGGDEFQTLLQAAAADMDGLNLEGSDWPARAIVGTLEDEMRETGQKLIRRAQRLRTVLEAEAESEQDGERAG